MLQQSYESAPDLHSSSDEYARRFAGGVGRWMLDRQERCVRQAFAGRDVHTTLDVGGGHGQLCGALAALGISVTVVGSGGDVPERIASAVSSGKLIYLQSTLDPLAIADRSYDAVVSVRIVTHAPDWRRQVLELCRVARRLVVIDYPPRRSLNILTPLLFGVKKRIEGNTRTYAVFSDREMDDAFASCGFRRVYRRRQFGVPMGVHRMLGRPGISQLLEQISSYSGLSALFGSPVIAGYERHE